jgi:hypothetical protein
MTYFLSRLPLKRRSTIAKVHAENDREPDEKCKEFYAFQTACQYVDEVREVIP